MTCCGSSPGTAATKNVATAAISIRAPARSAPSSRPPPGTARKKRRPPRRNLNPPRRLLAPPLAPLRVYNQERRSKRNVAHHYDLSAGLYDLFLDADRQYSCAYFTDPANTLEQAQAD